MSSPTADSLNLFASESTFSSSSVESVCGSVFDMPRTLSSGTEGCSSIFEHASSSEDGFSVYSGEDTNLVFSDPFADDAVEVLKSPSNAGTNTSLRQRLSSSGSRRSSMGSATSSVLKDDVEAGYEADSDARTTASRRSSAHRRRARSRRGSATVHYLVERVEPTIEVLAPVTPEELAYLKAHTNIPIPAHYQALLPKDAGKTPETPSTANLSSSETPSDRMGCASGRTEPVTTLRRQHLFAELECQRQPDLGCGSYVVDESLQHVYSVVHADTGELTTIDEAFTVPPAAISSIDCHNHTHAIHLRDLPPTPDLRPRLAVASGEPSPMVLTSPAVPLFLYAARPPLTHMPSRP